MSTERQGRADAAVTPSELLEDRVQTVASINNPCSSTRTGPSPPVSS